MLVIISHNKNQYLFEAGKEYDIVLNQEETEKKKISFSSVLLISDNEKNIIGQPEIAGASVEAEILGTKRGKKITVIKFHAKKGISGPADSGKLLQR